MQRLTLLALARQGEVSKEILKLYCSEICSFREDDISVAIRRLALRPRREGETAFPTLGTLYAAIRHEQFEREEHERKQDALEEEHNVFRGKILEPAKWYSAERIADGVVDRAKAAAAERGIDWTVPYQHEPYEPNADHWWS
jgi:hypothetical protein